MQQDSEATAWNDFSFNADQEEGTKPRSLIPRGTYTAEAVKVDLKTTKNGRGQIVNLDWLITEGEHAERHVFQSCLVRHDSAQAQAFGRAKLKDVCTAVGATGEITDLDILLNKPVAIVVGIETDKSGNYGDRNKVAMVRPIATKPTVSASAEMSDAVPF
jgi:Protein of unknown function (DUF669)